MASEAEELDGGGASALGRRRSTMGIEGDREASGVRGGSGGGGSSGGRWYSTAGSKMGDGFLWDGDVFYSMMQKELLDVVESASLGLVDEIDVNFASPLPLFTEGVGDLVSDEFTRCFRLKQEKPWNWNIYLWPAWFVGALIRYGCLLPLRTLCLVTGTVITVVGLLLIAIFVQDRKQCNVLQRSLIQFYANTFIASWSGVVKYHGSMPKIRPNQVYVANHSTMIDYIILLGVHPFAVVGQLHTGLLKLLQTKLLRSLGCIWFDRKTVKDRHLVRQRIKDHAMADDVPPLLIFPEGTCVNNEYCVMFKKGAFELDCDVHPVAIKYNKVFVDAFWDSKSQTFWAYLLKLMRSWALVCDVWFLPPESRQPGESPEEFANRVKQIICKRANLVSVEYDGYMKHMKASDRFVKARQQRISRELLRRMEITRLGPDHKADVVRQRKNIMQVLKTKA